MLIQKHESLSKEMDQTNLRRLDLQNEKDELLEKMQILRVETQSNIQYIQTQLETTQKVFFNDWWFIVDCFQSN